MLVGASFGAAGGRLVEHRIFQAAPRFLKGEKWAQGRDMLFNVLGRCRFDTSPPFSSLFEALAVEKAISKSSQTAENSQNDA